MQQLLSVNYTFPPYSTAYPPIVPTMQNHPCVPVNVTVVGNSACGAQKGFIDVTAAQAAAWFSVIANNTDSPSC